MHGRVCVLRGVEDRAHFEVCGFAGPKRVLDRREIFVAVMHQLFFCLLWSQIGFQHRAPIEFGGFLLRTGIDRQSDGALL